MQRMYSAVVRSDRELPDNFKMELYKLHNKAKIYLIEENQENTIIVYVATDGIYNYNIKVCKKTTGITGILHLRCKLYRVESLDELYIKIKTNRIVASLKDIKIQLAEIERFSRQLGLLNLA